MTRADLLALAKRVEREEPSVDLDLAVLDALTGTANAPPYFMRFTSSLDAAASLHPPAWIADISDMDEPDGEWCCTFTHSLLRLKAHGNAPDEPRARTAAALRAMAQEARDDG